MAEVGVRVEQPACTPNTPRLPAPRDPQPPPARCRSTGQGGGRSFCLSRTSARACVHVNACPIALTQRGRCVKRGQIRGNSLKHADNAPIEDPDDRDPVGGDGYPRRCPGGIVRQHHTFASIWWGVWSRARSHPWDSPSESSGVWWPGRSPTAMPLAPMVRMADLILWCLPVWSTREPQLPIRMVDGQMKRRRHANGRCHVGGSGCRSWRRRAQGCVCRRSQSEGGRRRCRGILYGLPVRCRTADDCQCELRVRLCSRPTRSLRGSARTVRCASTQRRLPMWWLTSTEVRRPTARWRLSSRRDPVRHAALVGSARRRLDPGASGRRSRSGAGRGWCGRAQRGRRECRWSGLSDRVPVGSPDRWHRT